MSCRFGGDKRDRTADLLTASQALSQLSYTPEPLVLCGFRARNIDKYNKIIAKYLGEDAVPTEEAEADADATETPAAEEEAAE